MDDKVLIKSKRYKVIKVFYSILVFGLIVSIITAFVAMSAEMSWYNRAFDDHKHNATCYTTKYVNDFEYDNLNNNLQKHKADCEGIVYSNSLSYGWHELMEDIQHGNDVYVFIPIIIFPVLAILVFLWLRSYELTVTDKRVFGKAAFGKRVDLPMDSVSAIATVSLLKGISVSTSSGKISFLAIKNATEIYQVINNLLIERQKNKPKTETTTIVQNSDEADMLKKYKDLLDSGVITQEEFDAKKKQLLGL